MLGNCLCDGLRRMPCATRVVVVMGRREAEQTSNTGRLAVELLEGASLIVRGQKDVVPDFTPLRDPARQAYLLFPAEGAPLLDPAEVAADGRPVTLVVPDACWSQARRMTRHEPDLANLPRRRLPDPATPGMYALREAPTEGHLSTFEAIAEALALLEGPQIRTHLLNFFITWHARHLSERNGVQP
jgi:DTW domain-containing protein YfiP